MKKGIQKSIAASVALGGVFLFSTTILADEVAPSSNLVVDSVGESTNNQKIEDMEKTTSVPTIPTSSGEASTDSSLSTEEESSTKEKESLSLAIVDSNATQETKELYAYLKELNGKSDILFGQQHALDEGVTLTSEGSRVASEESDVKNAVGDYPAVVGWDTLSIDGHEKPGVEGDTAQSIANLSQSMKKVHELGGIVTLSTHPYNFVTGGDFKDTSGNVVEEILPGGAYNQSFNEWLDKIALLADSLKTTDNKSIPFIFRPFHEQTGSWFWWGESTTNPEQYKALYRYTVEYLRDEKNIHNILYAYSPGAGNDRYLDTYPGDEYVDIFGIDSYDSKENAGSEQYISSLLKDVNKIVSLAEEKGKIAALTEFGYSAQGLKKSGNTLDWYTKIFKALQSDAQASKIAYMMTWANFGMDNNLYTPYKDVNGDLGGDHELLADFQDFYKDANTLFRNEVGNIYRTNQQFDTTSYESRRYLLQGVNQSLITQSSFNIVAKAAPDDTQVTYSLDGAAEIPLTKEDRYYKAQVLLADTTKNKVSNLVVRYYSNGVLKEETHQKLFLKPQVSSSSSYLVDDFEDYLGENELLNKAYSSNGDPITLALVPSKSDENQYRLSYQYRIADNGYAGRQISFDKDWSEQNAFSIDIESIPYADRHLTLQIRIGGVSFEKDLDLTSGLSGTVIIPFGEFKPASWESQQNAQITKERLKKVSQFAIYIGGQQGEGQVFFDNMQAVQDPTKPAVIEKEQEQAYQPLIENFDSSETEWQGNTVQIENHQLLATVSAKNGEKSEIKWTKGQDLSVYNWYVMTLRSSQPISAKLYLKVGDSWNWVNSDSSKLSSEFSRLTFDLSSLADKTKIKEIGIELLGLDEEEGKAEIVIKEVAFLKELSELSEDKSEMKQEESTSIPEKKPSDESEFEQDGQKLPFIPQSTELKTNKENTLHAPSETPTHAAKENVLVSETVTAVANKDSNLEASEAMEEGTISSTKNREKELPATGDNTFGLVLGLLTSFLSYFLYWKKDKTNHLK